MILVTGGARSGKSSFAEGLLKDFQRVLYIATSIPFDDEMKDRVIKHKKDRPNYWDTLEKHKEFDKDFSESIASYQGIILDCVTIMISNIILEICENNTSEEFKIAEEKVMNEVKKLTDIFKEFNGKVVLVTNEVGFGIVPESKLGRYFRDIAGKVNQFLATESESVYLVVSSIPMKIK
ncbi:bifunctional adenosylcobinamide kinase/adenosylcobinamide-phosphate guanylyltransferase [Clostridium cylindrosporum]|uniref:Adenosylcobinamide kinase n=1 Tax=Clostridium cylindrosporum DSM 605 TaxID=1121307 RepID=A0A0J8FZ96_CLOCY|nr:bifunctional adenosylcobinamide kinase/adenosylcobinamide-phosphate guanylyltransferase [Clostridium cylindrosporum]KMT20936.1 bifunctional adenosylcobalamin biosynthesis protein CobU [Clostridium cylindrosporum DSM 605]